MSAPQGTSGTDAGGESAVWDPWADRRGLHPQPSREMERPPPRAAPAAGPPRTLEPRGPLPIPLLLEKRRQRAESLQVLDGRGHNDAGQPDGQRPGRRHLADAEPGDND